MGTLKLYQHQEKALGLTRNFNRVAYYIEMGLGKTYVASEKLRELNAPYNLLICQKSKICDWVNHFNTYYDYQVTVYNKKQLLSQIPTKSIIIINYDSAWRRSELKTLKNFTLILDESQYIKNDTSKRAKFILRLHPINVILLSGTPIGGRYEELWSQLCLLGWNISKELYWRQFVDFEVQDIGGVPVPLIKGYKNVERLKLKLQNYGAIFMKTEEAFELPEQIDTVVNVPNIKEYGKFEHDRVIEINNTLLVGHTSLTKLLYLRQLASVYNMNKRKALQELLESTNDRIIIFYNFNAELHIIKETCCS
jgi:hypothetical protein